tara:strand:+ start:944 stop:1105 length:162 start_codon:yes stop_codon:yes gene_type:complete
MTKKEEISHLDKEKQTATPMIKKMMEQRILILKQELGIIACDLDGDECISCSG